MARPSQTATAVLGVLSIEPQTGYEIRQAITDILGHFWHESFGQIYPCLADLEEEGLVSSTPGDRPRSSRYQITEAGRTRLHDLLSEPATSQAPRNGLLLRVFFGRALDPGKLARMLDELEAEAQTRMASYAGIRAAIEAEDEYTDHAPFWNATIRAGELAAQAQLTWAAETRAALAD
jgi:DNA-binding PadR family transcriptional regulator